MNIRKWTATLTVAAIVMTGMSVLAVSSAPILVDSDLRGVHWMTAFTNAVPLTWEWNTAATQARLDITGMGGAFTTNFTDVTSAYLWQVFASEVPASEDVYALTLTFYSGGEVVEALTSRLAIVTGAFGGTVVNAVSNSPAWSKVKTDVVIPYDAVFSEAATNAASAQLVIAKEGGAVQTNSFAGVAGYFGWKIQNSGWGYGVFDLSLTFPGTAADALVAELTRPMDGTLIRMQ